MDPPTSPPAARDNAGKAPMDFILDFPIAMEALARVMEVGAVKYERDNWKKGGKPDAEYFGAAMRHLFAAKNAKNAGEDVASDTGCLHAAHAVWNLLAYIELNMGWSHETKLFQAMLEKWTNEKG